MSEKEQKATAGRDITQLLHAWSQGDPQALQELTPLVYGELRRAAQQFMSREKPGHVLQSTALINEVYVRLTGLHQVDWQDRDHFFAVCSQLMRRVLTDYARSRLSQKRGGETFHVQLDDRLLGVRDPHIELLAFDEALTSLAELDERKSQVVQMRVFGGLSMDEIAEQLKISGKTARRDWSFAQLWIRRKLSMDSDAQ